MTGILAGNKKEVKVRQPGCWTVGHDANAKDENQIM